MALFNIVHITKHQYSWPIKESINEIRLYPQKTDCQEVMSHEIVISSSSKVEVSKDYYGNQVGNFNILEFHSETVIESRRLVRVNHSMKIPEIDNIMAKDIASDIATNISLTRLCYPDVIEKQADIDLILDEMDYSNKSIIAIVQECSQYIFENFTYTTGITNIETTVDEILEIKKGVCQDFAHLLLQLVRTAGIPARYVSGYICPNESGFRGEGATHAWVEIYSPKQGWLGLDPTNNIWTMNNHVILSIGRNFNDCTPVKGTFKGLARQTLPVSVSIDYEDGRHIEATNDVKTEAVSPEVQEKLKYLDLLQQQQQQQQQ